MHETRAEDIFHAGRGRELATPEGPRAPQKKGGAEGNITELVSWAICQSLQTSAEDHHFPRHGSEPVDICFKQTNPRDIFGTCWNMGMINRGRCRLPGRERKKENTKSKESRSDGKTPKCRRRERLVDLGRTFSLFPVLLHRAGDATQPSAGWGACLAYFPKFPHGRSETWREPGSYWVQTETSKHPDIPKWTGGAKPSTPPPRTGHERRIRRDGG